MLNEFNTIRKNQNESATEFNMRFQKGMHKLFQVMRLDDNVCLTTYFNAFDGKMRYLLRDKEPRTLRDVFRITVNIENNMKISGKLGGKRDDPKLFGDNKYERDNERNVGNKKKEEDC